MTLLIRICPNGHKTMFRQTCPECKASRHKQTLEEKRASIAHARSCRVKRGDYRPIQAKGAV